MPVPCEGARRSARFPPGGGPRLGHGAPGGRAVVRRVGGVASARRRAAVAAGRDTHGCVRVAVCAVARPCGVVVGGVGTRRSRRGGCGWARQTQLCACRGVRGCSHARDGVVRCARAGVRRCGWPRWLRLRIRRARRGGAPIPAWLDGDEARGGCSAAVVRKRTFCCFQCYPLPLSRPRRLVSPRTGCNWAGATTGVEALEVRENDKEQARLPLPLLHETAHRHAHGDFVPPLQASTNALVSLKVV